MVKIIKIVVYVYLYSAGTQRCMPPREDMVVIKAHRRHSFPPPTSVGPILFNLNDDAPVPIAFFPLPWCCIMAASGQES